jgi:hypothetical protein
MRELSDEEFYEDFGTRGLSDAEIDALLEQARVAGNREVRLLVEQFVALRRAARWLVADLDAGGDVQALRDSGAARLTRFLAGQDDPTSGTSPSAT